MAFDLRNAPTTLQSELDKIPSGVQCKTSIFYLNKIPISSKHEPKDIMEIDERLKLHWQAEVDFKFKNYHLFQAKSDYHGDRLMRTCLSTSFKNVCAIRLAVFSADSTH